MCFYRFCNGSKTTKSNERTTDKSQSSLIAKKVHEMWFFSIARKSSKKWSAMAPNKSTKNGTANGNDNHLQNHENNNNISSNNNNDTKKKNGSALKPSKKQPPQKQIKIKKPKTRDSGCCSINFIKYVLIIIDIVFFVSINFKDLGGVLVREILKCFTD